MGEPTRLGDLVLFRGASTDPSPGLGAELWAFETDDPGIQPPPRPPGVPAAPDRLELFATGIGGLTAVWRDRSGNETSFVLQARNPLREEFETVAVLAADVTRVRLGLTPGLPWVFRVRAENATGVSAWSEEASGRSQFDLEPCVPSDEHLCLLDGLLEALRRARDVRGAVWPGV